MSTQLFAQSSQLIATSLGDVCVFTHQTVAGSTPILLLHGVYLDHQIWEAQLTQFPANTLISIDMPWHGESPGAVPKNWTLDDCATMILDVITQLEIEKVYGVGHSWGSMTLLRAAHRVPKHFEALLLCNMPLAKVPWTKKLAFQLQHTALPFRGFYQKQAAKSLFDPEALKSHPEWANFFNRTMSRLSNKSIKNMDRNVILTPADSQVLCKTLEVPAIALRGEKDYVPAAEGLPNQLVPGGHVSPLEVPTAVTNAIREILLLKKVNNY